MPMSEIPLRTRNTAGSQADGHSASIGSTTDAESSSGNGGIIALLKRLRTLLNGGLPAALGANGGLKVEGVAGGVAQPVSGTVTANAGTGTLAVSLAAGAAAPAKAEDAASADADVGVPAMAVRKATPANTSGTDGDYEMLQISAGRLWASATIDAALPAGTNAIGKLAANDGVDVGDVTINNASGASAVNVQDGGNSLTVDNGGTFAVQDSEKLVDNAAFTDGTTKVQPVGFIFDETAGTGLTENDIAAARLDSKRAQVAVLEDATTRGQRATVTAANALKVDGSAVTQPVSIAATVVVDSELPAAAALNGTIAKSVSAPVVGAALLVSDNTNFVQPLGDAANGLDVDVTRLPALATGSNTIGNVGTVANATGGYSKQRYSAQTTTVQTLKGTAGKLAGWMVYNPNSSVAYIQIFDVASATTVTLGTTAPDLSLAIPATGGANLLNDTGIDFTNGIKIACTTTVTGSTAPGTGLDLNLFYK